MITDAPWYVPNAIIGQDLQLTAVKEDISQWSSQYSARLRVHPNDLTTHLTQAPDHRRLKRYMPIDLTTRFYVLL
jgi:hypothetical protein